MSFSCTSAAPLGSCHYLLHLHTLSPTSTATPPAGYPAAVYPAIYCVASAVACSERSSLCLVACTLRRLELYLLCASLLYFSLYTLSLFLLLFSLLSPYSLQLLFSFRPLNFALCCCHKVVQINCDAVERQETNCCCCEAATRN